MSDDLKVRLDQVIATRENGDLQGSKLGFNELLQQVNKSHELYPRLMAEYVIQLRLEAKQILDKALSIGQELLNAQEQKPKPHPLSIRSVSNTLIDLGNFEQAIPLLQKLTKLYADNSLRLGETQAHLSYAYLRVSKVIDAFPLIEQAIHNINLNSQHEDYVEVRESYAYIVKALIENAVGKKDQANTSANQALSIAQKGKASHRIIQAQSVITFLSSQ